MWRNDYLLLKDCFLFFSGPFAECELEGPSWAGKVRLLMLILKDL